MALSVNLFTLDEANKRGLFVSVSEEQILRLNPKVFQREENGDVLIVKPVKFPVVDSGKVARVALKWLLNQKFKHSDRPLLHYCVAHSYIPSLKKETKSELIKKVECAPRDALAAIYTVSCFTLDADLIINCLKRFDILYQSNKEESIPPMKIIEKLRQEERNTIECRRERIKKRLSQNMKRLDEVIKLSLKIHAEALIEAGEANREKMDQAAVCFKCAISKKDQLTHQANQQLMSEYLKLSTGDSLPHIENVKYCFSITSGIAILSHCSKLTLHLSNEVCHSTSFRSHLSTLAREIPFEKFFVEGMDCGVQLLTNLKLEENGCTPLEKV